MEVHVSSSQPQAPAFDKPKPSAKPKAKRPISAAKASKPVTSKQPSPPTRVNAKGQALACQVSKCKNPARWKHQSGAKVVFTCTTHHKAIERGKKLAFGGSATALWANPAKIA